MSLGFLLGIKSIEEGVNEFAEEDNGDEEEDEEDEEDDEEDEEDEPFNIIEEEGGAGN